MIQKTKAGACPNYCHIHWDLQLLDLQGFPSIAPPSRPTGVVLRVAHLPLRVFSSIWFDAANDRS
jgi:hypothetical protein